MGVAPRRPKGSRVDHHRARARRRRAGVVVGLARRDRRHLVGVCVAYPARRARQTSRTGHARAADGDGPGLLRGTRAAALELIMAWYALLVTVVAVERI